MWIGMVEAVFENHLQIEVRPPLGNLLQTTDHIFADQPIRIGFRLYQMPYTPQ